MYICSSKRRWEEWLRLLVDRERRENVNECPYEAQEIRIHSHRCASASYYRSATRSESKSRRVIAPHCSKMAVIIKLLMILLTSFSMGILNRSEWYQSRQQEGWTPKVAKNEKENAVKRVYICWGKFAYVPIREMREEEKERERKKAR